MTEVLNHPSVRELIAELAKVEDALRLQTTDAAPADGSRVDGFRVDDLSLLRLLRREQEIVGQLRRPRPAATHPRSRPSTTDSMEVTS